MNDQQPFSFDEWIVENELSAIKSLFQKHHAITREALSGFTPRFSAVMADPELLDKHGKLMPKIMTAMQAMSTTYQKHIVVTEVEQAAMNKAEDACKHVMDDVLQFEDMMKITASNHTAVRQKVTSFFQDVITVLQKREKELLLQLDTVRMHKDDLFRTQIATLCGFKSWNDNLWHELLTTSDLNRSARTKRILDDSEKIIQRAEDLKLKNERLLKRVGADIEIAFEVPSKELVESNFASVITGAVLAAPSMEVHHVVDSTTVVFSIRRDYSTNADWTARQAWREEVDDLTAVEENLICAVEWTENQDNIQNSSHDWKTRELDLELVCGIGFDCGDITLDELSSNTSYRIRCKIKIANDVYTRTSEETLFKTE